MMPPIPELQALLEAVEARFKGPVRTTAGFERLAAAIEFELGDSLGATTLKRLWGYIPNRLVTLAYLGDDRFEVLDSANAKLLPGDRIEASCLLKGWPLFVPGILRAGTLTPPYIAGKAHGLSVLEKL